MFLRRASHRSAARLSAALQTATRPLLEPLENRQLLNAGLLDPSFGNNGVVADLTTNGTGTPRQTTVHGQGGVVIQSTGKLVTLGDDNSTGNAILVRYNADGSLDTTFGSGGRVTASFGGGGADLALGPGDSLIVGGGFTVARFNADGSLDTTFNHGAGYATMPSLVSSVAVQSDGKIVTGGGWPQQSGGVTDAEFQRLNADGTPDTTFGNNGLVDLPMAGFNREINDVVVESNGRIAGVGDSMASGTAVRQPLVVELNADGSPDGVTFDTTSFNGGALYGAAEAQGGGLLAVGDGALVVRYNTTGANAGKVVFARDVQDGIAGGGIQAPSFDRVAVQPDGKIVAAGSTNPIFRDLYVVRMDAAGNVDRTFGNYGAAVLSPAYADIYSPVGIAITGDDRVRIAANGFTMGGNLTPSTNQLDLIGLTNDAFPTPGDQAVPAAPSNLTVNWDKGPNGLYDGMKVSFKDNSPDATGFIVERAPSNNGPFTPLAGIPAYADSTGTVTFTDTTATAPNTFYYYRVKAVNYSLESAYSGWAGLVSAGDIGATNPGGAPAAPSNLALAGTGPNSISIRFTDNSTNESGFLLQRSTAPAGTFTTVEEIPASYGSGVTQEGYDSPVTPGVTYYYRVVAVNGPSSSPPSPELSAILPVTNGRPYLGTPFSVGQVIQAENFDKGGEGVAYHDTESQNLGGQYRPAEGVDIENTGDAGGGYDVGWTHNGEFLTYTLHADQSTALAFHARVANAGVGGSFHVEIDGVNVTGSIAVPDTGGFQSYTDVFASQAIPLTAGDHQVRIVIDGQGPSGFSGNFNWFQFNAASGPGSQPYGGTPFTVGQLVEAENYDTGGEGVAYHDTEPANLGGQYRPAEGVDIEANTDVFPGSHGNEYDVGWTHSGEWLSYTGTVAQSGNYDLYARVGNVGAGGSFHLSVDGVDVTGPIAIPDTGSYQAYGTAAKLNIPLTAGTHVFRITFDGQAASGFSGNLNWFRLQPSQVGPEQPLGGTPAVLPGRVEAERYDVGGEGVAYHDTTGANEGGQYRTGAGEAVDIESTDDGGYAVDYTHAGEWMQYTVNVTTGGTYVFDAHVADQGAGGAFHVEVDGVNVTGTLAVPDTGSYRYYTDVQKAGVALTAGQHVVRIAWDANNALGYSGNLDYFTFSQTGGPVSGAYNGEPAQLPGKVSAANYDVGGEGVAYHDADFQTNDGGQYRPTEGVDIESGSEGYDVGWTTAGEWLKYTVNVTAGGTYTFDARVANPNAGGSFHVEVDGVDVTGHLAVPNTGGWQTYTDVLKPGVALSAGQHVIRFVWDTSSSNNYSGNLAWFRFA